MDGYEFIPEVGGFAPVVDEPRPRPAGPWDDNFSVAPVIERRACAWCPDYDRNDPINKNTSHGICAACMVKALAESK